jgi:hypothetical protein
MWFPVLGLQWLAPTLPPQGNSAQTHMVTLSEHFKQMREYGAGEIPTHLQQLLPTKMWALCSEMKSHGSYITNGKTVYY